MAELLSARDVRTRDLVARKLLLGVPFYGYDMLPGDFKPILVSRFVDDSHVISLLQTITIRYNARRFDIA